MAGDSRSRPPDAQRPPTATSGLPGVTVVSTTYVRYDPPRKRAQGAEWVDVTDAVEIVVRTDADLQLERAVTPVLFVGDRIVRQLKQEGPNQYRFTLYDYRDVPRGATIAFGMPHSQPEARQLVASRYDPSNLPGNVA